MRWLILALAFCAACESIEHLPPRGPGGNLPPVGTNPGDAGPGDAYPGGDGAPLLVAGRLCHIEDLRYPLVCSAYADMSGITVSVQGYGQTIASSNGSFVLDLSALAGQQSVVLEAGFYDSAHVPSVVELDLSTGTSLSVNVPIMDATAWNDLLGVLDVQMLAGTGTIAVYLREYGQSLIGGQVLSTSSAYGVFYDSGGAQTWTQGGATGSAGAALLVSVSELDGGDLTAVNSTGSVLRSAYGVPVKQDALTFVTMDLSY